VNHKFAVGAFVVVSALGLLGLFWTIHPNADEFLGTADFEGSPIHPAGNKPTLAQATYNGVLTFTNLDRALVEALLPKGYQLAKNKSFWQKSKHPVALLFGDQTDAYLFALGHATPTNLAARVHYSEMILGIPFVQKAGQPGWHTYIVRMYLDDTAAVLGGAAYGYAKLFACLDWTGSNIRIWRGVLACPGTLGLKKELLVGEFGFKGAWLDGDDALTGLKNFQDMNDIWTTRILGRTALDKSVCSYFEWDFSAARVARAVTTYSFESAFRGDMSAWPALGKLDSVAYGAATVRGLRWRLAAPFSC
jgi:hypothetical protein